MMKKTTIALMLSALCTSSVFANADMPSKTFEKDGRPYETITTPVGDLTFANNFLNGIPTDETAQRLFDQSDFQRATQAYIWAVPMMGFYAWKASLNEMGGEDGRLNYLESYDAKIGGLTYNTSTPYAISFIDIEKEPAVITIPTNQIRGAVHTMWQIGLEQMTKPGTYVVIPKGSEAPKNLPKNATVIESDTNYVFLGLRLMSLDKEQRMNDLKGIRIEHLDGKPISDKGVFMPEHGIDGKQPRGIAFWKMLNEAIQKEPIAERDRMMHDFLRPLGIQKGKEFNPTDRQKAILEKAVVVGEAMAKNIDFNKTGRLKHAEYGPEGNTWEIATASTPEQNRHGGMDLDGRTAWMYEAVTNDIAMHGFSNGGWGQIYLDNYRDTNRNSLDGSKHYTLTLNGDVKYAETFWTITVYNVENRAIVENDIKRADVGSNIEGTMKNEDGNYVFHFSPTKPEGVNDANWVQTDPDKDWFVYFRTYSPSKAFYEQKPETILPNFIEVK